MKMLSSFIRAAVGVCIASWSLTATATPQLYNTNCTICHAATPNTCNGCHSHGTHSSSAKNDINVAGTTNKTSYAPGETVTVTMTGGYRTGWLRGLLLDQNLNELARSTCPGGFGNCTTSVYPITLTAPAPSTPGTYSWAVSWYGNYSVEASGASFGLGTSTTLRRGYFTPDSNNPDHGYQVVTIPSFTVVQPATPAIALSPASLAFGTVTTGSSASLTTQIQNPGNATLTVSSIALCSGTPTVFTWSPSTTPFTVPAGGATTLTVTYTPVAATTDSGCLAIASNATATPTVNLAVSGTGQVPQVPRITVTPTSLAFGDVTVGTSSSRSFSISNTGTAPLIGTVAVTSGTTAPYTVSPSTFNVAAGGSVSITVTFSPTSVAPANASLTVASNDTVNPAVTVTVTGNGVAAPAPNIALNPTSLAFGTVTIGGQVSMTTQVQNVGTAPLNVTAIALCSGTPATFTWSPAAPFTVAPNGSTSLTVTYAPTAATVDSGCLAIASNDTSNPSVQLGLSGTGQPAPAPRISVSPTALDFGTVTVGASTSRTFTIGNTGTAQLTGALALATPTSDYTFSPTAFSVAPGGTQVVTVTFGPTQAVTSTDTIVVSSNDTTNPTVSVSLTGTGVSAPVATIALSPSALAFGTVTVSSSASLVTQVQNTGTAPLTVSAISLCSGTSTAFSWSPAAPFTVNPGSAVALTVTYAPLAAGVDTGCLALASNDLANPSVQLTLSGTGVAAGAPKIALAPASLDFGSVVVGSSVTRTSLIRNDGTADLAVSSITLCTGTSSAFSFALRTPLTIAPGQSQALDVTYAPSSAGTDTGCLLIASNDPANATVTLAVTATATAGPPMAVDIDIRRLRVPHHVYDWRRNPTITPRLDVVNSGTVDGTATATLVASIGAVEVYRQTAPITLAAGQRGQIVFPSYQIPSTARGVIVWVATIDDGDPDVDRVTARTILGDEEIDDSAAEDDHSHHDDSSVTSGDRAVVVTANTGVQATGGSGLSGVIGAFTPSGCSSTSSSGMLPMLLAPLAVWALRRKPRARRGSLEP